MTDSGKTLKRSKLGILIRLIGVLIVIGWPIYLLSPELFSIQAPDGPKFTFNLVKTPVSVISLDARLFFIFVGELQFLILVVGLFSVATILDMVAREHWFLPDFSKHLKTFGISLIVYQLSSVVVSILFNIAWGYEIFKHLEVYSDYAPHFKLSISGSGSLTVLIGIVLITVSKVLKKASVNANELEQIV